MFIYMFIYISKLSLQTGDYHYLHVSKPHPPIDLETAMLDANYGRELITDDKEAGYFR